MTGQEPHTNYHRGVGTARTALTTAGFSTSGRSAGNPTPLPPPSTWAWGTAPGTPGGAKLCLVAGAWSILARRRDQGVTAGCESSPVPHTAVLYALYRTPGKQWRQTRSPIFPKVCDAKTD